MIHRVDGPIGAYRGESDAVDRAIQSTNRALADATVFQSHYSLRSHRALGLEFRNPAVIPNAVDPGIFHPHGHAPFARGRKVRLVSASWSDNVNKGAETYAWLDTHLDWDRFDYTFVGRAPVTFAHSDAAARQLGGACRDPAGARRT